MGPAAGRRRAARVAALAAALVAAALMVAWMMVAQPLLPVPAEPAGERADPARLEEHVRRLTTYFFPRDEGSPDNLRHAAGWIGQRLEAAGGRVTEHLYDAAGSTYRNVYASFGPETGARIIVGAHYDTAGRQPGADDNASGVAGLIELGVLLGRYPPRGRVDLAAYALEEPPHFATPAMGSAVHAAALRREGKAVRAMIALEMIGRFDDAPGSQGFPVPLLRLFYPSRGDFIMVVGALGRGSLARRVKRAMRAAGTLPVHSINAPRFVPGIDFSDHLNFWAEGYDAVMITDTAFYRNPDYHTLRDTPDTLDYPRMAQVVEGVHAAVLDLAGS